MSLESYSFGLNDCKVAVWNSAENYGTAVDVESIQLFGLDLQTISGELTGDDIIVDTHAQIISASVRIRFGFKTLDVIEVLSGVTVTDSSPTSKSITFGRDNMPYFAMAGKISHTEGDGDLHVFIPKCKLMDGLSFSSEYGQYMTQEINATAVYEGATYGIARLIPHATAAAVTIPIT